MNETENKNSGSQSIWLMVGLIVVLLVGVKLIFSGLKAVLPPPPANPYEVMDAVTEQPSPWKLEIAGVEEESTAAEWLSQCEDDEGFHGLMETSAKSWDAYVLLPEVTLPLTNPNVSLELVAVETDEGESAGSTLTLYVNTLGLKGEAEPADQILHLTAPEGETWPNQLAVVLNGAPMEQASQCIYTGGQLFFTK